MKCAKKASVIDLISDWYWEKHQDFPKPPWNEIPLPSHMQALEHAKDKSIRYLSFKEICFQEAQRRGFATSCVSSPFLATLVSLCWQQSTLWNATIQNIISSRNTFIFAFQKIFEQNQSVDVEQLMKQHILTL